MAAIDRAAGLVGRPQSPRSLLRADGIVPFALLGARGRGSSSLCSPGPNQLEPSPTWGSSPLPCLDGRRGLVGPADAKLETVGLLTVLGARRCLMYNLTQYPTPDLIAATDPPASKPGSKTDRILADTAVALWLPRHGKAPRAAGVTSLTSVHPVNVSALSPVH